MGLLSWLTGRSSASRRVAATLPGPGPFAFDVVGESNYQGALAAAAGGRTEAGCEKFVNAVLVLEDSNPHDSKAVQVLIGGKVCGYLSGENARAYRKQLRTVSPTSQDDGGSCVGCDGLIFQRPMHTGAVRAPGNFDYFRTGSAVLSHSGT